MTASNRLQFRLLHVRMRHFLPNELNKEIVVKLLIEGYLNRIYCKKKKATTVADRLLLSRACFLFNFLSAKVINKYHKKQNVKVC